MVSIIVTTHNYGHYLAEALISVKEQSYTDWECIVVDSGSTDNTKEIMERFLITDNRFKYFFREDKGVSSARNAGIKKSNGEFIQFLDGDDLLQKNKIEEQLNLLLSHPETDIVYGEARFFDYDIPGILRTSKTGTKSDDWMPRVSGKGDVVLKYLKSFNFLVTHAPLLRRTVINKCGMFDEHMEALEDWDFWLRCAGKNSYFEFHEGLNALALVRVHGNSLSRKLNLMRNGNFIMLEKAILNSQLKIKYKLFFTIKYTELFWDTLFSPDKIPNVSLLMVLLSILLFPVWLLIKLVRLIFTKR